MELRLLEIYRLKMKLIQPFETSFGTTRDRMITIVRVEEKGGEEGWGECVAGEGPWYSCETYQTAIHVIKDYIAPMLKGQDIDVYSYHKIVARIRGHNMAKAAVEEALWDLKARMKTIPLHKLLGGVRESIESGVSIGVKKSIELLLKEIGLRLEEGYRRIKIKIKPGWDVNVVREVRNRYKEVPLQVDANAAYSLNDIHVLKALDNYRLLMIEQPLGYDDLVDHAKLAKLLKTPICLDESIKTVDDARKAFELGSAEIINIKPGRVGGLLPSKQIHDYWRSLGKRVWIGGMLESGIGRSHLVALATLPGVAYPNDISASNRYYDEDIVEPPWSLHSGGFLKPLSKPGIGVEINWEIFNKKLVGSESVRL